MTKPVIVLVPGAWHPPSAFDPLTKYLEAKGYTVDALPLQTVDANPPRPNFDADVQHIAQSIEKHADAGSDVVLLTHSYGGNPGSTACKGLLKSQRAAAGKNGGIVHKIYWYVPLPIPPRRGNPANPSPSCSFLVPPGVSLMDALGGDLPWFRVSDDKQTVNPATPIDTFYNDISDRATLDALVASLGVHSYQSFYSKNEYAPWLEVPSTYIVCALDQAIPEAAQRGMIAGAKAHMAEQGGKFEMQEVTMEASHSPFVSRPEELGEHVAKIAGGRA